MSKIAIIDGDVLCYQACKSRWQKTVELQGDGINKIHLDENGKRIPLEFTEDEDAIYLGECIDNLVKDTEALLEALFCTEFMMAVKGPDNFRNLMYPEYKLNRHADPTKQNQFVPVLRKVAVQKGLAIASDGREADDLMRIWAEECRRNNQDYIICSIDKDLKCIPGQHWFMHHKKTQDISEQEALRHYYEQLLKGDPTDNIPGVPRVGEVKAAKILAPFTEESDFQEQVVDQYIKAYGDQWESFLLSNGKMVYLQKHPEDYFTISDWPIVQELRGG